MIALSMVLRGHPMSLGGVFMMLSCFVMRVFWHSRCPLESIFDSPNTEQVMNHWTLSSAHPFLGEWRIPRLPHQKLGCCGIPLNRSPLGQSGLPPPFAECAGFSYVRTS